MKYVITLVLAFVVLLPTPAGAARLWSAGWELNGDQIENSNAFDVSVAVSSAQARTGTYSLRVNPTNASAFMAHDFVSTDIGVGYGRFYLYIVNAPSANTSVMEFTNKGSDTTVCGLTLSTTGTLQLYTDDPGNTIGAASMALSTNTWYRIEVLCDSSVGGTFTATARIDGTQFATGSFDNGGEAANQVGRIELGVDAGNWLNTASADLYFDDIAVNDTSGTVQTNWAGEGKLVVSRPNAAGDSNPDGCNNTSPCGTPANAYLEIDETTPDDATTFIDFDTAINADFNMQDSSTVGIDSYDTVTLIDVGYRAREEVAAATSMTPRIKSASGGTTSTLTAVDLGNTTWRTNQSGATTLINRFVSYVDPTTSSAWTPTGTNSVDNMQVGAGMTTGTADFDVSALWAYVEYVDGSPPGASEKMRARVAGGRIKVQGGRFILRSN